MSQLESIISESKDYLTLRLGDNQVSMLQTMLSDSQLFLPTSSPDPFQTVLNQLSEPIVTTALLQSQVRCVCPCLLGAVFGLEDGSVLLIGPEADIIVLGRHCSGVIGICGIGNLVVSGSSDATLKVWRLDEMREVAVLEGHTESVNCVSMTPDGNRVLSGSKDNLLKLWSLVDMTEIATLKGHESEVLCMAIASDGRRAVSGSMDYSVKVWDLEEGKELKSLLGHSGPVRHVALTVDGKFALSGADDTKVKVWSLSNMTEVATFHGHNDSIACLSLTPNCKLALSAARSTLKVWSLETMSELTTLRGHNRGITCLSVFADGKKVVSGALDTTVKVWDLEEMMEVASLECHTRPLCCLAMSLDEKRIMSGASDMTVRVWSLEESPDVRSLQSHSKTVWNLFVSPDGKYVVSGSGDNTVKVWDLELMKEESTFSGHTGAVFCVLITPDGKQVISGSQDWSIKIWDLLTFQEICTLKSHTRDVWRLATTSDGKKLVSGSTDMSIKVWDLDTKMLITTLQGHNGFISCFCLTVDGHYLYSGALDKSLRVWDLHEMKSIRRVWLTSIIWSIALLSDGVRFVTGSEDKALRIYSLPKMEEIALLQGHTDTVRCISASADGKYLISGSMDSTLKVWSLEKMEEIGTIQVHSGAVYAVTILPEEQQVISGSADKSVLMVNFREKVSELSVGLHERRKLEEMAPVYYLHGGYVAAIKSGKQLSLSVARRTVLPYFFNSLHVCAHFNQHSAVALYLQNGVPILKGMFGSPLSVALKRNTMKCIDAILQYIGNDPTSDGCYLAIQAITDDFPQLLLCSSSYLVPFFSKLIFKSTQLGLPQFIVPLHPLPFTLFKTWRCINLTDFAQFKESKMVEKDAEVADFLVSLFRWNFSLGSTESLRFLRALEDCEDKHILTTPLVMTLVESKWDELYLLTCGHTLLYIIILLCLILITFKSWRPDVLVLVFLPLNAFFLLYEMVQIAANGLDYWKDVWNYVDLLRSSIGLVWGGLFYYQIDDLQNWHLAAVCLCFLRGFTYFRTFKMTRMFVRMTVVVIKESYAFLVILAYSTCSFGMMYAVLCSDQITNAAVAWTTAYQLLMGTYSIDGFGLIQWLFFTAASLVNVIIMLNLLISILGDAYRKAQEVASENDTFEMLRLVIEYESMFFWRRKTGTPTVIIECKDTSVAGTHDVWEEKVNHMLKVIKEEMKAGNSTLLTELVAKSAKSDDRLGIIEKKLATLEQKLETELKDLKSSIGSKLDQVLAVLQSSR